MDINWLQRIKDKDKEFDALYKRMDRDANFYRLKKFEFTKHDGTIIKESYPVTLPIPATFANRIIDELNSVSRQIVVESADKDFMEKKASGIEEMIGSLIDTIDHDIAERGFPGGLYGFHDEGVCIRGRIAARSLLDKNSEDKWELDVLPIDTRYASYEMGDKRTLWYAWRIYKTKAQILKTYGVKINGDNALVRDLWTEEENMIWIGDRQIKMTEGRKINVEVGGKHDYEEVPVVQQVVPTGSMLLDKKYLLHSGESIFWLIRGLIKEINRCASIEQTQNMNTIRPPFEMGSEEGTEATLPDEYPLSPGKGTAVDKEGFIRIPRLPDMIQASRHIYAMIYSFIQQGSLTALDYGNLTFPLSAVAIKSLTKQKDPVFLPRLQTIARLNQQLAFMIIDRMIKKGIDLKLGRRGFQKEYKHEDLKGEYGIGFHFVSVSPEENIANYSVGAAARGLIPDEMIRRDIIKVDEPEKVEDMLKIESAYRMPGLLRIFKECEALERSGKLLEARLHCMNQLKVSYDELKEMAEKEPSKLEKMAKDMAKEPVPTQTIPLLGKGAEGRAGPAKEAEQLKVSQEQG